MGDNDRRVGDYEILAALGSGGMGRVFKVRNVISNREEAMKILHPDFASDPDLAARFMAEIRTLAGLDHPGIAQLRTAFQYQNQFVMVMEFVEGATLDKLAAQTRIPVDRMLDYASQVLAALSYAHGRGVTHRDIKPLEHHDHHARLDQADGLRHRKVHQRHAAHTPGNHHGLGLLYVAGTGARRNGRCALGPLFVWGDAL